MMDETKELRRLREEVARNKFILTIEAKTVHELHSIATLVDVMINREQVTAMADEVETAFDWLAVSIEDYAARDIILPTIDDYQYIVDMIEAMIPRIEAWTKRLAETAKKRQIMIRDFDS